MRRAGGRHPGAGGPHGHDGLRSAGPAAHALFLFLDAYYLALEQVFRNSYNAFVRKLHGDDGIVLSDLYVVRPVGAVNKQLLVSLRSTSIWPFYPMLVIAIALVWKFDCVKALLGF